VAGGIALGEPETDTTRVLPRLVRRRRPLPSGRAVFGGFLVAVAAVGTFAAAGGGEDRRVAYVVARGDLAVGHRLKADDLATARLDVPDFVRARAFRSTADLVGAVVVGPVARGELLQASAVVRGEVGGRQVSFPVDGARAVDGTLQPGEAVDVLVTYGTGEQASTAVVARRARVVRLRRPSGTLSDGRNVVVTLSVDNDDQASALAHAASAGTVTLVRVGQEG
jgi:Flp pilus assembly protein CpaB